MRLFWLLAVAALAACTENPQGDGPDTPAECSQPNVGTGVDILGVRLGMDKATAIRILRCVGYTVEIKSVIVESGNPANNVDFGVIATREGDSLEVRLDGISGKEQVVGISRLIFGPPKEGSELSADLVLQAMRDKYGPLIEYSRLAEQDERFNVPGQYYRVGETKFNNDDNAAFRICGTDYNSRLEGRIINGPAHPSCGEFVSITIQTNEINNALVEGVSVDVSNGMMEAPLREERRRLTESYRDRDLAREVSDAKSRGTPDF